MNAQWASFLGERAALRRGERQWIGDLLAGVGVAPSAITHVVLMPLQLYTTSNVTEFANATVALAGRGWNHFHRTKRHPHDDRWSSLPPEVLHHLAHDAWDRVRLLADEDEIVPGVRTRWSGAHHRASMLIEIDSTVGTVTVTDSYFVRRNLENRHLRGPRRVRAGRSHRRRRTDDLRPRAADALPRWRRRAASRSALGVAGPRRQLGDVSGHSGAARATARPSPPAGVGPDDANGGR